MHGKEKIRREYDKTIAKKKELTDRLKEAEKSDPSNLYQIWILRDQIAYWEGKAEGLQFALDETDPVER